VTIHDLEFYGDEMDGQQKHVWMPFTLSELVPMSLALRDVTLGLVELAFPESRPTVKEEYQHAIQ
jgi:ubiquitin-protein ligase E3 C